MALLLKRQQHRQTLLLLLPLVSCCLLSILPVQVQGFTSPIIKSLPSSTTSSSTIEHSFVSLLSPGHDVPPKGNRNGFELHSSSPKGEVGEGLSVEKISTLIEVTFIQSCLQIATGYVDILKLFLATLKAAYDQKIPMPTLIESVASMDITRNTANRPLMEEEISLRTLWMNIAYLTLECLYRMESNSAELEFDSNMDEALDKSLSVSLTTRGNYKFVIEEKVLKFLGRDAGSNATPSTPGELDEAAMMEYSLKIIDLILVVVKEERFANEPSKSGLDGDGVGPPRPNIPGAYS